LANLWRILAIAWLGGFASPVLAEEPPDLDAAPPAAVAGMRVPSPSALECGDDGLEQPVDHTKDRAPRA
jgi:hypothetical protein